jgi:integrase
MPSLRTDKGRLFIDFVYRGERCRESLGLADNRGNWIVARQLRKRVDAELALGTFDYGATFPRGKKARKFGGSRNRDFSTSLSSRAIGLNRGARV